MDPAATIERTLVLGIKASGEHFNKIDLLSAESGSFLGLRRIAKTKPQISSADLFDSADIHFKSSQNGNIRFVNDYQLIQRRSRIGQSYRTLHYAADFCALIALNGPHIADPGTLYSITERTLNAFAKHSLPSIVFLKAVYILLKDEGYPVREAWWSQLTANLRQPAKQFINQPTPECASPVQLEICTQISRNLCHWLRRETDLMLPNGLV